MEVIIIIIIIIIMNFQRSWRDSYLVQNTKLKVKPCQSTVYAVTNRPGTWK